MYCAGRILTINTKGGVMKRKLIIVGCMIATMAIWGVFAPEKDLRFLIWFIAMMLSGMWVLTFLDYRAETKKTNKSLRFLIVCENTNSFGCPSVADAVSDYLAYLFLDTGSGCDFVDLVEAEGKIADNLRCPEEQRYRIVFFDTSVPNSYVALRKIVERFEFSIDKEHAFIGVGENGFPFSWWLPFDKEEWMRDRKIFQRRLRLRLKVLNLLPEAEDEE